MRCLALLAAAALSQPGAMSGQAAPPDIPAQTAVRLWWRDGHALPIEVIWLGMRTDSAVLRFPSEDRTHAVSLADVRRIEVRRGALGEWGVAWPLDPPAIANGSVVRIRLWQPPSAQRTTWLGAGSDSAVTATLASAGLPGMTLLDVRSIDVRRDRGNRLTKLVASTLTFAAAGAVVGMLAASCDPLPGEKNLVGWCYVVYGAGGALAGGALGLGVGIALVIASSPWERVWP